MPEHEPLRVDWTLDTAIVVPQHPLHLDALLAYARVEQALGEGHQAPWSTQHDLPLERYTTAGGQWCFMASWVEFETCPEVPPQLWTQTRRASVTEWAEAYARGLFRKMPRFDPRRGATKAAQVTERLVWARQAHAYGVGDIESVERLLKRVGSLGKLRRHAAGRIAQCRVVRDDSARWRWTLRNLPATANVAPLESVSYVFGQDNLHAPYFDSRTRGRTKIPVLTSAQVRPSSAESTR